MEEFNPDTQYLIFKPIYTDLIEIFRGDAIPYYIIDPFNTDQDAMQFYWNDNLEHLFDVMYKN